MTEKVKIIPEDIENTLSLRNVYKLLNDQIDLLLTEDEKEVLSLVKEVTLKAYVCTPELLNELKKDFSEAQVVEIVSIIGLFNYINRFNNTLCILPE